MAGTHVHLHTRHFIVEFNDDGTPRRIKERKKKYPPSIGIYDQSYWEAKHHTANPGTMPAKIIEAAKTKNAAS